MATVNYPKRTIANVPREEVLAAYTAWKMGADLKELAKGLDVNLWALEHSFEFRKRMESTGALEHSFEFRKRMESTGALEGLEVNLPGTRKPTP
jgi:hypothetical protein